MLQSSLLVHLLVMSSALCVYAKLPASKDNATYIDDCSTNSLGMSIYCRGTRALRNVIHNLNKSEKPIIIVRGLEIVRSKSTSAIDATNATEEITNSSSGNDTADVDESFLGSFSDYLRTHELNIKFSHLLAEESEHIFAHDLERDGVKTFATAKGGTRNGHDEVARKKDKGQGILMVMALMFGKVMAVLGLGGIGALAMKALGIALTALMMAGILSLKSMSQQNGGQESNHNSVHYLTPETHFQKHRRRRSLLLSKKLNNGKQFNEIKNSMEMVYSGW